MTNSLPDNPSLDDLAALLAPRTAGVLQGSALLEVTDMGGILLTGDGAQPGTGPADVTLTASLETFRKLFDGKLNPMMAVMTRKLKVDGTPNRALKVAEILLG